MHATSLSKTSRVGTVKTCTYFSCWKLGGRQQGVRKGEEDIRTQSVGMICKKAEVKRKDVVGSNIFMRTYFYRHADKTTQNQYAHLQIRMLANRAEYTHYVYLCT